MLGCRTAWRGCRKVEQDVVCLAPVRFPGVGRNSHRRAARTRRSAPRTALSKRFSSGARLTDLAGDDDDRRAIMSSQKIDRAPGQPRQVRHGRSRIQQTACCRPPAWSALRNRVHRFLDDIKRASPWWSFRGDARIEPGISRSGFGPADTPERRCNSTDDCVVTQNAFYAIQSAWR